MCSKSNKSFWQNFAEKCVNYPLKGRQSVFCYMHFLLFPMWTICEFIIRPLSNVRFSILFWTIPSLAENFVNGSGI